MRANVRRALETGIGVHHVTWQLEPNLTNGAVDQVASDVIAWSRGALDPEPAARLGPDRATIAIVVLDRRGRRLAGTSIGICRRSDILGFPLTPRIQATLQCWAQEGILGNGRVTLLKIGLLDWAELNQELLLAG